MNKLLTKTLCVIAALTLTITSAPLGVMPHASAAVDLSAFKDAALRNAVQAELTKQNYSNLRDIETLNVSGMGIQKLDGIETLTRLKNLNCSDNSLSVVDLSKNTKLETLDCSDNKINYVNLKENEELKSLKCSGNALQDIDLSKNYYLKELNAADNVFSLIDLTDNTDLETLILAGNQLASLTVTLNTKLKILNVAGNKLTALDASHNAALKELYIGYGHDEVLTIDGDYKEDWNDKTRVYRTNNFETAGSLILTGTNLDVLYIQYNKFPFTNKDESPQDGVPDDLFIIDTYITGGNIAGKATGGTFSDFYWLPQGDPPEIPEYIYQGDLVESIDYKTHKKNVFISLGAPGAEAVVRDDGSLVGSEKMADGTLALPKDIFVITAYCLNYTDTEADKWVSVAPGKPLNLAKLLDKGIPKFAVTNAEQWIGSVYGAKANRPLIDADHSAIVFPEFKKRPGFTSKPKADYAAYQGKWYVDDYVMFRKAAAKGSPSGMWSDISEYNGGLGVELPEMSAKYEIALIPSSGKNDKGETYWVPASKPAALSVAPAPAAPKVAMSFVKESFVLKRGVIVMAGVPKGDGSESVSEIASGYSLAAGDVITPDSELKSAEVSFGGYLGSGESVMTVWTAATVSKPASKPMTVKIPARAEWVGTPISLDVSSKGSLTMPKTYEIWLENALKPEKSKWGKSLPKLAEGANAFNIRMKSTVPSSVKPVNGVMNYTGGPASAVAKLTVTAVKEGAKIKIVSAVIEQIPAPVTPPVTPPANP